MLDIGVLGKLPRSLATTKGKKCTLGVLGRVGVEIHEVDFEQGVPEIFPGQANMIPLCWRNVPNMFVGNILGSIGILRKRIGF
jgi:hypothetical protein